MSYCVQRILIWKMMYVYIFNERVVNEFVLKVWQARCGIDVVAESWPRIVGALVISAVVLPGITRSTWRAISSPHNTQHCSSLTQLPDAFICRPRYCTLHPSEKIKNPLIKFLPFYIIVLYIPGNRFYCALLRVDYSMRASS